MGCTPRRHDRARPQHLRSTPRSSCEHRAEEDGSRTRVVSGGTAGIGRELAASYLDRGDRVVIIGRDAAKGRRFLEEADRMGSGANAFFIEADLGLVSENLRVVEEIRNRFPALDTLVLCARFFRSYRRVTSEGFEHNFALHHLSRYLLGYGLVGQSASHRGTYDGTTWRWRRIRRLVGHVPQRQIERSSRGLVRRSCGSSDSN
ncbi:SDR family NAD(P)-dependent oxidoreductase [Nocardia sp. NPDC024068]|uniref:SDR family NAD(P)-dependent oxidoreductase n=1 Tax=Nocardia sp. NPDC024068 TaxID=3157197 RepID=UPI0033DEE40D